MQQAIDGRKPVYFQKVDRCGSQPMNKNIPGDFGQFSRRTRVSLYCDIESFETILLPSLNIRLAKSRDCCGGTGLGIMRGD